MLRYILWLLVCVALSSMPARAEGDAVATLVSEGRELRVPLYEGYVTASEDDPDYLAFFSKLMNRGKLSMIEVIVKDDDIERTRLGLDPGDMVYKIATDPMFGTAEVDDATWARDMPRYRAGLATVDTKRVDKLIQEKIVDTINDEMPDSTEFGVGEISPFRLYRSEPNGFRAWSSVPLSLKIGAQSETTLYLTFGSVVNLRGRVFLLSAEVVAPQSVDDYERRREQFDRFVDRVIALNGGITRG